MPAQPGSIENMDISPTHDINGLVLAFMDLQDEWESGTGLVDWDALEMLAQESARAYNTGSGPSFHSLVFDGVRHSEIHERFLALLLRAGFDPFQLVAAGAERAAVPAIGHADLARAAGSNPFSSRMRASLLALARERFEPLARKVEAGEAAQSSPMFRCVLACAESVPEDLMRRIVPELIKTPAADPEGVNPVEAYLSPAEVDAEYSRRPRG